jgi:Ca2+-binding RTX toxin-like protein
VWARAYNANGTAIGNDFKAISSSSENFGITALTNGGFAVSSGDIDETYVQSFNANLQASSADAVIDTEGRDTEIVGLQDRYMVLNSASGQIFGTIRNNDGSAPTGAATFNISTTGGNNYDPTATRLADGRIVVVWTSKSASQSGPIHHQIKGQILDANGTKSGGELLLSAPDLLSSHGAAVTALADGGFALGYMDRPSGRNSSDVHISTFSASGVRVAADTILGRSYQSSEDGLDITTLADGRLTVAWDSFVSDWDDFGHGVQGQIVDLRQAGVTVTGTAADESYYGSRFNDAMKGEAGNDRLFGHEGNDAIAGGLGNDVLLGQGGRDTLTGGDGSDAFVFDSAPIVGRARHIDRIADFNGRADKIYLDDIVFKGLTKKVGSLDTPVKIDKKAFWKGQAAHDKDDRIVVKTSGEVLYDADGTGKGKAVVIAKLDEKALKFVDAGDFFAI